MSASKLTLDGFQRAKRTLKDNANDAPQPFVLYTGELRVLGYEKWDEVKPGDHITWNGQAIIVAGAPIPNSRQR